MSLDFARIIGTIFIIVFIILIALFIVSLYLFISRQIDRRKVTVSSLQSIEYKLDLILHQLNEKQAADMKSSNLKGGNE